MKYEKNCYQKQREGKLNLYVGGGLTSNTFREKNPIGEAGQSKVGLMLKVGTFSRIKGFNKRIERLIS